MHSLKVFTQDLDRQFPSPQPSPQNGRGGSFSLWEKARMRAAPILIGVICFSAVNIRAEETSFSSATISGLGARNIGSAAMSGRISAIAGVHEPSGKITLFVAAASGGVWKSDDGGTRYRPVFDEQDVQSIGAIALDPKNPKK